MGIFPTNYYLAIDPFLMSEKALKLIEQIEAKTKKLSTRYSRLEKENEEMRSSIFEYIKKMDEQKKEIQKLQLQLKTISIGATSHSDKKKLQREIDKYILLIDKCIAAANVKSVE